MAASPIARVKGYTKDIGDNSGSEITSLPLRKRATNPTHSNVAAIHASAGGMLVGSKRSQMPNPVQKDPIHAAGFRVVFGLMVEIGFFLLSDDAKVYRNVVHYKRRRI